MRKWICVPMILLCLLLAACGGQEENPAEDQREPFQTMSGCSMTADVTCGGGDEELTFTLRCNYVPEGETTVEVLAPESAAGVRAVLSGQDWTVCYEEDCLPAGTLSTQQISPAACLPQLMEALRSGWLLEECEEERDDVPCLRLTLDQTGDQGGKIVSSVWLRQEDGIPLRGEIAVDDEIILTAEFTEFAFGDILSSK